MILFRRLIHEPERTERMEGEDLHRDITITGPDAPATARTAAHLEHHGSARISVRYTSRLMALHPLDERLQARQISARFLA